MRTALRPDGAVVVGTTPYYYLAFGAAEVALGAALVPTRPLVGGGLALIGVATALLAERSEFVFLPRIRRITWKRGRFLRSEHGELGFDQVQALAVEEARPSFDGTAHRLVLVTDAGRIPVDPDYWGIDLGRRKAIAAIRTVLDVPVLGEPPG